MTIGHKQHDKLSSIDTIAIICLLMIFILSMFAYNNYLLFHTLVEGFCIIVASLMYVMATKTYRHSKDDFLLFLGTAYLFIAFLDFLHLISYEGIDIIITEDANIPTQLWLIARYLEACTLFVAPLFIKRSVHYKTLFLFYTFITVVFTIMIFHTDIFPVCYVDSSGLTNFKIFSEYVICLLTLGGAILLYRQKNSVNRTTYIFMESAMACLILSELSFTLYVDVYGIFNFIGHVLKLAVYYLIYQGIIRQGLETPYDNIFNKLNSTMNELYEINEKLAQQQKKLEQANLQLRKNNRLKNEMLNNINHELKSPLAAIIAFTELLADEKTGPLNDMQRDYLFEIADSSKELNNRVNEIMRISKVKAGKVALHIEPVDIKEIVTSMVRRIKPQFDKKGITIAVKPETELSCVMGDKEKIGQIITNLLFNALKFTPAGGMVSVKINEDLSLKMTSITIEDNGIGIASEHHQAVFQLFFQVDGTDAKEYDGSGIGLALVKSLVELQGGRVYLESTLGKGSKFSFTLPLYQPEIDTLQRKQIM